MVKLIILSTFLQKNNYFEVLFENINHAFATMLQRDQVHVSIYSKMKLHHEVQHIVTKADYQSLSSADTLI